MLEEDEDVVGNAEVFVLGGYRSVAVFMWWRRVEGWWGLHAEV